MKHQARLLLAEESKRQAEEAAHVRMSALESLRRAVGQDCPDLAPFVPDGVLTSAVEQALDSEDGIGTVCYVLPGHAMLMARFAYWPHEDRWSRAELGWRVDRPGKLQPLGPFGYLGECLCRAEDEFVAPGDDDGVPF